MARSSKLSKSTVLITNALIGSYQEYKADVSARALRQLVQQIARVRAAGITRKIPSAEIFPGDIVELESGMKVTADIRLLSALGLRVDETLLTGESKPVAKDVDHELTANTSPGDRLTMAHAGTTVVEGRAVGVAVATGTATLLGEIGKTLASATRSSVAGPPNGSAGPTDFSEYSRVDSYSVGHTCAAGRGCA